MKFTRCSAGSEATGEISKNSAEASLAPPAPRGHRLAPCVAAACRLGQSHRQLGRGARGPLRRCPARDARGPAPRAPGSPRGAPR
eukprot:12762074-Alexandrium_andersonii.AAC.1